MMKEPSFLNLNDYEIKWNQETGEVTSIVNKKCGPVIFNASLVDNKTAFIETQPVLLYTETKNDIFNIVHCHLHDYADFVTVDTIYLKINESVKDHKNMSVDSIGLPLNY